MAYYFLLWGHILPYPKDGLVQPKHIRRAKLARERPLLVSYETFDKPRTASTSFVWLPFSANTITFTYHPLYELFFDRSYLKTTTFPFLANTSLVNLMHFPSVRKLLCYSQDVCVNEIGCLKLANFINTYFGGECHSCFLNTFSYFPSILHSISYSLFKVRENQYESESKVLQYFNNARHNSAALDVSDKVGKGDKLH